MLRELHIRNFAVVETLDLEFGPGMNVFTGETGAGKSIIVDAMGLILGDRADSSVVRGGQDRADISAVFTLDANPTARALLGELEIETGDDEVIIRRVIGQEGRSRGFINSTPVPIQQLKSLGECLVELHGQHSHQSLLKSAVQRALLDFYGHHEEQFARVRELFSRWSGLQARLGELSGSNEDREARLALLEYQVDELDSLALGEQEYAEVSAEVKRLTHLGDIMASVEAAHRSLCTDEPSALDLCAHHHQSLARLLEQEPALGSAVELVNNAVIQLQEVASELRDYLDKQDTDPGHLAAAEKRLDRILETARKHRIPPEALNKHAAQLRRDLEFLKNSSEQYELLLEQANQTLDQYRETAAELSRQRTDSAKRMGLEISTTLARLGMPAADFKISVSADEQASPSASGMDRVEYLFTANPGQALKPVSKVASGGELSRISLAIQVTATEHLAAGSLVFDEVDSGIGGGTASIVGELLHSLSGQYQVFCVTHLAQVAAFGDYHYHVAKMAGSNVTRTQVRKLEGDSRVEEIARMMGGARITEQSLAHAREMLGVGG